MPRPATTLPTANEVYDRLDRPPWHAVSSVELAALLGVPLNWIWNAVMRSTGPEPEPGDIHVRASNRRFFLPCLALEWLSRREGAPVPAREWCRRWLAERRFDPGEVDVLVVVEAVERTKVWGHRWKVRQPAYRERLRGVLRKKGSSNTGMFIGVEAVP